MLIDLKQAIHQYDMHIKGVIHIGAHWGQEYGAYKDCGIDNIVFIEPCADAYKVLAAKVGNDPNVVLYNCGCDIEDGERIMNVERRNQGQSNSILKPKMHLQYYREIVFEETEIVHMRKLDNLTFSRRLYNLLMIDTQGAELLVLRGAVDTLRHIDYLYVEVNTQELYEDNAMVWDIDEFLKDFKRVTTQWVGNQGWGDAIYIRKKFLNDI